MSNALAVANASLLPPGWKAYRSRRYNGRAYYVCARTGETQWTVPAASGDATASNERGGDNERACAKRPAAAQDPTGTDTKRVRRSNSSDALLVGSESVMQYYDAQASETRDARRTSPVLALRRANNAVKSQLIERAAISCSLPSSGTSADDSPRPITVIGIACGKGGDLPKWGSTSERLGVDVSYYGCDFSAASIAVARQRYEQTFRARWKRFHVKQLCARDMLSNAPDRRVPSSWPRAADVVSVQFALHYAFASEQACNTFFAHVAAHLRVGGWFIGTVPDATRLCSLDAIRPNNSVCSIALGANTRRALARSTTSEIPNVHGLDYTFTLSGCVNACTEYMVPRPLLEEHARRHGMRLHTWLSFDSASIANRATAGMTSDERDVFRLYSAFVFVRDDNGDDAQRAVSVATKTRREE